MRPRSRNLCAAAALLLCALPLAARPKAEGKAFHAVLLAPGQVNAEALRRVRKEHATGVVLGLSDGESAAAAAAARRVRDAGLDLYYWIEVGRCPALADAHPEWMASLQGHPEWRRFFPGFPKPAPGEVVKNYPWVPVLYKEAFAAHLARVDALLKGQPTPKGVFLNDLQAAPSACGCGNRFCRWVTDYGPIRTATPLPADAAAKFVAAVGARVPGAEIIPVWTTECEEHEMKKGEACDGVPCFANNCWYTYTEQLMPVARGSRTLAALLPYKAFGCDGPRYGPEAGWVARALASFQEMPPQRKGEAIPAGRLLAVLQGWDVTPQQRRAQVQRAEEAGAKGYVVSEMPLDQRWEPRMARTPGATVAPPAAHQHEHEHR